LIRERSPSSCSGCFLQAETDGRPKILPGANICPMACSSSCRNSSQPWIEPETFKNLARCCCSRWATLDSRLAGTVLIYWNASTQNRNQLIESYCILVTSGFFSFLREPAISSTECGTKTVQYCKLKRTFDHWGNQ
jgi:hypothetical protein